MASVPLPQDIILLLCEELATRRDFTTLFRCSLVSRRVSSIALEKLYGIHESSRASFGDARGTLAWPRLWRSIILSSIRKTAYPYCTYLRYLSLGNLEECLQDVVRSDSLDFFFRGDMERFRVSKPQDLSYLFIDILAIIDRCADSITDFIEKFADDTGTAVTLAHLEGTIIPHDRVSTWIARLRTLTTLRIRDGSVLGVEAASAISECCPNFTDLTFFYCCTADEDLAAFFRTLRPNSLRSFQVISLNTIGGNALAALNAHAKSLKTLILGSLSPAAIKALNLLSSCTALETLTVESDHYRMELADYNEELLREISAWIGNCKSLRNLTLGRVPNALPIVKDVLAAPDIHLVSLSIICCSNEAVTENPAAWATLGLQDSLEDLTLGLQDAQLEGLRVGASPRLADSICQLKNLTSLNLIQSSVSDDELCRFAKALPKLSELSFSGDAITDSILEPLSNLSQLKLLEISAISNFSFAALLNFATRLDTPGHRGIRVDILNQLGERKLTTLQFARLKNYFGKTLKGTFDITYFNDPDELHESDFSDVSD
ncbi:hypothetical protein AAE478_002920 [Parahypoxylon ruwenzoriense]